MVRPLSPAATSSFRYLTSSVVKLMGMYPAVLFNENAVVVPQRPHIMGKVLPDPFQPIIGGASHLFGSATNWSLLRPQSHTNNMCRRMSCVFSASDITKRIGFRQSGQMGGRIGNNSSVDCMF